MIRRPTRLRAGSAALRQRLRLVVAGDVRAAIEDPGAALGDGAVKCDEFRSRPASSSPQRRAERKRHILLIVPASLRKQWSQEHFEKFSLPDYRPARRHLRGY
jgi:hypothetical protein